MKQSRFFFTVLIIAAAVTFNSCAPAITTTASWVNREKIPAQPYKSVFIMVLTNNLEAMTYLENDLAKAAEARGLKAYKSIDELGPIGITKILPVKDVIASKLKALNCETIFIVAMLDKTSETRYVPGSTAMYMPNTYGGYGAYGMYGGYGGYYGYAGAVYSPGYYTTDKTYFLQSNLYDAKTEDLLLSIQSKAENPAGIQKSSQQYTQTLMDEIQKLQIRKN